MNWKLFCFSVNTTTCAGLNFFMLCFTDQGEIWERMQGMILRNTEIYHNFAVRNIVLLKCLIVFEARILM